MDIRIASNGDTKNLASFYTQVDPDQQPELTDFWYRWFNNEIPGAKITLLAQEDNKVIGAVRLWQSPFCDNKWLVEGLEVAGDFRRLGIGLKLVEEGIKHLTNRGQTHLYAHIHRSNMASISLHSKLGFVLLSEGYINSWGDPRPNGNEYVLELSFRGFNPSKESEGGTK